MKVIVTGGLGYIGSHVAVLLLEQEYDVVVVDNLSNSSLTVLDRIKEVTGRTPTYEALDLQKQEDVQILFSKHHNIDGLIHFAALKAVGESVQEPLKYYQNNINGLVYLLNELVVHKIPLIFSSSCTVYGEPDIVPINEKEPLKPTVSPYGGTKQMGETIIQDVCIANKTFNAILLRYFNPIGAHPSGKIGEIPQGVPGNLVPFLMQTAIGKRKELFVFGADYPTPDGTCIRDYIHVMDLAHAHILSLKFQWSKKNESNCEIFNLGTGKGNSVLELIQTFESSTGQKVNYKITSRREGDITQAYADPSKAKKILGWQAEQSLASGLKSAWEWEKNWQNEESS